MLAWTITVHSTTDQKTPLVTVPTDKSIDEAFNFACGNFPNGIVTLSSFGVIRKRSFQGELVDDVPELEMYRDLFTRKDHIDAIAWLRMADTATDVDAEVTDFASMSTIEIRRLVWSELRAYESKPICQMPKDLVPSPHSIV